MRDDQGKPGSGSVPFRMYQPLSKVIWKAREVEHSSFSPSILNVGRSGGKDIFADVSRFFTACAETRRRRKGGRNIAVSRNEKTIGVLLYRNLELIFVSLLLFSLSSSAFSR